MTPEQDRTLMIGYLATHLAHPHDAIVEGSGMIVYPDSIEIRNPWTGTLYKLTLTELKEPERD